MANTEVSFVFAFPGWEVLYYFKGGRFESTQIVAWAIHAEEGMFIRTSLGSRRRPHDLHAGRRRDLRGA